ncbi:MAG: hypothetical protein JWO06_3569 [Bacteroidota bacterium]|nr:hypothetical protein [Bacteroidota bacterium]
MAKSKIRDSKKIADYQSRTWKHFDKYFRKFLKKREDESLHELRIAIKRIFALVHFIEFCTKQTRDEQLKPLKRIFHLTGQLRDSQNANLFCQRFVIEKTLLNESGSKYKKTFKKLKAKHHKYADKLDQLSTDLKEELSGLNARQLMEYFTAAMGKIVTGFTEKTQVGKLHDIRKQMKDLSYLAKLQGTGTEQVIGKARFELLEQIEDLIGDWHDINKFRIRLTRNKEVKKSILDKVKKKEDLLYLETLNLAAVFSGKKPVRHRKKQLG